MCFFFILLITGYLNILNGGSWLKKDWETLSCLFQTDAYYVGIIFLYYLFSHIFGIILQFYHGLFEAAIRAIPGSHVKYERTSWKFALF